MSVDDDPDADSERWQAASGLERSRRRRAARLERERRRRRQLAIGSLLVILTAVVALLAFGPLELLHLQL